MTDIHIKMLDELLEKQRRRYKFEGVLPDVVEIAERLKWLTEDEIRVTIHEDSILIQNESMQWRSLPEGSGNPL